jgi:2-polyprenyl-3-methyl-5-hydroxy-6-metoxy-1,4-benzoquinol methylase
MFNSLKKCPLCDSDDQSASIRLNIDSYVFGGAVIDLPDQGINLVKCKNCYLLYKDKVPKKDVLASLFEHYAPSVWNQSVPYTRELECVKPFFPIAASLDVGCSNGDLIGKLLHDSSYRSGLDVYYDKSCQDKINGKYYQGFIEDKSLKIYEKYNLVTMFDVLEHLYSPSVAFKNCIDLMDDNAILLIETGDYDAAYNISNWWYAKYIEHHVFWNKKSLLYAAKKHSLDIFYMQNKAHKSRLYMNPIKKNILYLMDAMKNIELFRKLILRLLKYDCKMVGNPYLQDHILMACRK